MRKALLLALAVLLISTMAFAWLIFLRAWRASAISTEKFRFSLTA